MSTAETLRRRALYTVAWRLREMAGREMELDALAHLSPAELDVLAEREGYFT